MAGVKLVVPDGSMEKVVTDLLTRAHIQAGPRHPRTGYAPSTVSFIDVIRYRRPQIIPRLIKRGRYDVGIAGQDWMAESGVISGMFFKIPRGKSSTRPPRIVLAVKQDSPYQTITDLPRDCTIVSEYPKIASAYCRRQGREDIKIEPSPGQSEAIEEFDAEAAIELTDSGESLIVHNLREIDELMTSSTVLIANHEAFADKTMRGYIDCLVNLIAGAWKAQQLIYLIANVPRAILTEAAYLMGGLKAPTVSPTTRGDIVSVAAYVPLDKHIDVILALTNIGVTDIGTFESGIVTSTN